MTIKMKKKIMALSKMKRGIIKSKINSTVILDTFMIAPRYGGLCEDPYNYYMSDA